MTTETSKRRARDRYIEATPRSRALYERALAALPGGNTRTTLYVQPYPFYFAHGEGCRMWDVDGIERLDFINNYTSLILGHSHPRVVAAVAEQAALGMSAAAPTELEVALAEAIKQRLPSVELLRFTNSGTEATMLAIRVARAFSGREKLAKFDGAYHGSHDYAAVELAAGAAIGAGQFSAGAGIPEAVADSILVLPFNDPQGTTRLVEQHAGELAAIIVEPIQGAGGIIAPQPGFLALLRELCDSHGIVLIFDEIIAFRVGYGGAQGRFGVRPDLTTLGKIIGGGLPVGAVGGQAAIMGRFDPRRDGHIGHGGTFNANPMTAAAGLATLAELTPERFERLETLAALLREQLLALFAEAHLPAQVHQVGSLFAIHLSNAPVTNYAAAARGKRALLAELYLAALNQGVAFTARGMGCLSTPMGEAEVAAFVGAMRSALEDVL